MCLSIQLNLCNILSATPDVAHNLTTGCGRLKIKSHTLNPLTGPLSSEPSAITGKVTLGHHILIHTRRDFGDTRGLPFQRAVHFMLKPRLAFRIHAFPIIKDEHSESSRLSMGQNTLSTEEKLNLITRRQSFLEAADAESLKRLLEEKPKLKLAWETTPTGKPHVGYLVPIAKLLDFLRAGLDVTVYYLDVYGFLVNYIHSMETVAYRQQYYHFLITAILKTLGVSPSQINFVAESSIAYEKDFVVDVQRLCAIMTQNDARDTSNEVAETEKISPLLCSIHQSLSEPYLDLDIQYGGEDQTGLFKHANKFIPMLGYRHREHLMNTMVVGLDSLKMSSSKPAETKIEFLDGPETVRDKIFRAACPGRQVTGNGVLGLLRDVLIPISEQRVERLLGKTGLNVHENNGSELDQRPFCSPGSPTGTLFTTYDENGEEQNFASYEAIEATFVTGQLQPEDLSRAVADSFNVLLAPIRAMYTESAEWQKLDKLAYA